MTAIKTFLSDLFSEKPEDEWINIWTLDNRKSFWQQDIEKLEYSPDGNVFFGLGTSKNLLSTTQRIKKEDVCGIPAFWLDIDYKSRTKKSENLPSGSADLRWILERIPVKYTHIVNSGNGVHVYWKFTEWQNDTEKLQEYMIKFQGVVRAIMAQKDWELDATHDLSRVLRLPGSLNHKSDPPKECKLEYSSEQSIEFNDMLEWLESVEEVKIDKPKEKVYIDDLGLKGDEKLDFDQFEALMENVPKARSSWERTSGFKSASEYDFSLAYWALQAGWTDKDTAILLLKSRRKYGDDLKLNRKDCYYKRTIERIKSKVANQDESFLPQDKIEAELVSEAPKTETNSLDKLKNLTNLDIVAVEKHGMEEAVFAVVIMHKGEQYKVTIGGVSDFQSKTKFFNSFLEVLGADFIDVKIPEAAKWKKDILPLLIGSLVNYNGEMSSQDRTNYWIEQFLPTRDGGLHNYSPEAVRDCKAFEHEENGCKFTYIHTGKLITFVWLQFGLKVQGNKMSSYLVENGWEHSDIYTTIHHEEKNDKKQVHRRYYKKETVLIKVSGGENFNELPF